MKLLFGKSHLFLIILLIIPFMACDTSDDNDNVDEELYVKFINNISSEYTITSIKILDMGVAGTLEDPNADFGNNILENGDTIAPGEHLFFNLKIPNSHYAYYRLAVDNGSNSEFFLNDQLNYTDTYEGTITHWGSDERTVSVTILENTRTGLIWIQSWSDMAGV